MPGKRSAGILVFRRGETGVEVLIGHMGGPFWARKDAGGWSVPKGEYDEAGETAQAAARREFAEELGLPVPDGPFVALGSVTTSGKTVTVWAVEGDPDVSAAVFGTFELEWPKGSGRLREFPELDRVGWFGLAEAADKLVKGQRPFLDRLAAAVAQ